MQTLHKHTNTRSPWIPHKSDGIADGTGQDKLKNITYTTNSDAVFLV